MTADSQHIAQRLNALLNMAKLINSSLELNVVLSQILRQATELLHAESGSIMLVEPVESQLRVAAAQGPRARRVLGRTQPLQTGVAGWVVLHGKPVRLHGPATDQEFRRVCKRTDVRDAMCAPLQVESELLGVICLSNQVDSGTFSDDDLEFLVALSHHAALAIRNARAFQEVCRQRRTVARLLEELSLAQERERARIALLLHDGTAQTLHAALRNAQAIRALSASGDVSATEAEALAELERAIHQALRETRAAMMDLRPLSLDEHGLDTALRQYVCQFERRTGIRSRYERTGGEGRLPATVESCVYRIVLEALTNVWKHAQATEVEVLLDLRRTSFHLKIQDNGKGISPNALDTAGSDRMGLSSLFDRAELIGGQLQVTGIPEKGTTIRLDAPIGVAYP